MLFLYYQLKVAICLSLLTGIFYILFRQETFHGFNRIYLVSSLLISLILPLIHIASFKNGNGFLPLVINSVTVVAGKVSIVEIQSAQTLNFLPWTYVAIAIAFAVYLAVQLGGLAILVMCNKIRVKEGYKTVVLPHNSNQSFSFFNLIFIHPANYSEEQYKQVIFHERVHARQFHSLDILLVQLIKVVQWFNPFIYFLEKALKETHEFLADKAVLEQDRQSGEYRQLLLAQVFGTQPGIFSFFNQSLIKNRLTMMTKQKSPSRNLLKYLVTLPFILLLGLMMCCEPDKTTKAENVDNEQAFEMVDEQASFQGGGPAGFMQWIQANLVYPADAKEKGITGRVVLQFTVNSSGEVGDAKVIVSASPSLDSETIRVLQLSPKWEPAKISGKPVKQLLVLPVTFALPK